MSSGRPAPVVAHLRRPFVWLPLIAAYLALAVGTSVVDARRDRQRLDRAIDVEGTLVDRNAGAGMARLRYVHPVTQQELTLSIPVRGRERLPATPGPVSLDADPDDPEGVRFDGDADRAVDDLGWDLPYLAIPFLVWGRRRWGVSRTERIMAGSGPSFAMLGAIAPSGRTGRRAELHLWPLDAPAGSPSLCRLGLLATSYLPVGGSVFNVEVKGRPRPFARLVARSPDTGGILWPSGAALPRSPRPKPATAVVVPRALPPPVADPPPSASRVAPPWAPLGTAITILAAGCLLLAAVTAVTISGLDRARTVQEGRRVVAEVTGVDEADSRLELTYGPDAARSTGRAPVEFVEEFPIGRRYPATVDPNDPSRLRLAKATYDPVPPIVAGAMPALVGLVLLVRALRRWRTAVSLAGQGHWRPFEMWSDARAAPWAALVPPGTGLATGSARLDATEVATQATSARPVDALVAGDPQPGGRIAVHFGATTRSVPHVGVAPGLRWWLS